REHARVERRYGPEHRPARPRVERSLERGQIAEAAAHLDGDGRHRGHYRPDQRGLAGRPVEGSVEIHNVQALGPALRPTPRHRHRIVAEDRGAVGPTLDEPHAPAPLEVDRRDDDHAPAASAPLASRAKFARSRSPQPWLFSGWNWVP